jgi:DNA-binding XRE family transcriptional regulator
MGSLARVLRQARSRRIAARINHVVSPSEKQGARKRLELFQEQFADVLGVSAMSGCQFKGSIARHSAPLQVAQMFPRFPSAIQRYSFI